MSFTVIIPARYASTRLPGKPLLDIAGKPMIIRVMEQAKLSGAENVIVATDHPLIADVVTQAGGEVCLTQSSHQSGTERLAEVIEHYQFSDETIIVNVQGDEPLIPPQIIAQVASNLAKSNVNVATLSTVIHFAEEAFNPNVVKVVVDKNNFALYFSRAVIPWDRDQFSVNKQQITDHCYYRHIGIYAYRAGFVRRYIQWTPSQLEKIEKLEQLRVLWYGEKIHVDIACVMPKSGVDTEDDLALIRAEFQ